jgi:hypothetical protein
MGPAFAHQSLLLSTLARPGQEGACRLLETEYFNSHGVGMLSAVYVDFARRAGLIPTEGYSAEELVSQTTLDRRGEPLLPKIEEAANAGSLGSLPNYYDIARAWSHLGGSERPQAWLAGEPRAAAPHLQRSLTACSGDHRIPMAGSLRRLPRAGDGVLRC